MEIAKDPKQAALAVVVFSIFIIYTLYNVFAYYQSQQVATQPNPEAAARESVLFALQHLAGAGDDLRWCPQ